jgi:hypothetical protein
MKDKTNITYLVNDVAMPGEIDELIDDEYEYEDEEEEYYDEYESLYSNGYGFMSMHKHNQPMRNFKHKRGDK